MEKSSDTLAIIALVLSIIGLFFFGYILGAISLVLGLVSLSKGKSGLAVAATTIGALDIILLFILQIAMK